MNIFLEENLEQLITLFSDSKECFILLDENKDIIKLNGLAKYLLGSISNIYSVEHSFNFDVCILREEDFHTYNPLIAALDAAETFKAEALYQVTQDKYKNLIIRSFNIGKLKAIILTDLSAELENIELTARIQQDQARINELEEFSRLKEIAEAQAIRVSLINKISAAIRDTLNIDEIIQITISETSNTLGVYQGVFAGFYDNKLVIRHEWNMNDPENVVGMEIEITSDAAIQTVLEKRASQSSVCQNNSDDFNTGELKNRIVTPVIYQGKILGIMIFYHNNVKKIWHPEEIALVEGISAQLAAAISQASLFEKTENQNKELEATLEELKKAQIQLIQSEKMASLGNLVAGVAHEINTPVGALNSNVDIMVKFAQKLKEKIEKNEDISPLFTVLDQVNSVNGEAISRINNIVKSLKNFARLDEAELKRVNIHEGIRNSIMLISHEIKDRIEIIENYSEIHEIECYPNLLNQVIMNLLVNAYQSIEGKGRITIKTSEENDMLNIEISDTGKGIREEDLNKIFDPGYTTKGVGVGTGLGLSICYQIIEKHCGIIKVDSEEGNGTKFTVMIPLSQETNC